MTTTLESATEQQPATEGSAGARGDAAEPTPARAVRNVRFHIFIIDTGWNCAASNVLREHIKMISDLNIDDELFVLDRPTSIALLRHYPLQVGRDPIIAVHDLSPRHRHRIKHTHGFRMHLGILDSELSERLQRAHMIAMSDQEERAPADECRHVLSHF